MMFVCSSTAPVDQTPPPVCPGATVIVRHSTAPVVPLRRTTQPRVVGVVVCVSLNPAEVPITMSLADTWGEEYTSLPCCVVRTVRQTAAPFVALNATT